MPTGNHSAGILPVRLALSLARATAAAADALLGTLYPQLCRSCGKQLLGSMDAFLCPDCHAKFPWTGRSFCACCGVAAGPHVPLGHLCRRCRRNKPFFRRAAGVARWASPAKELALSLKFNGDRRLARAMAAAMVDRMAILGYSRADVAVPVPLHRSRLARRGYNQAAWLSACLAKKLGMPHDGGGLFRTVPTEPQTGKAGKDRRLFPAGAFAARGSRFRGRHVLLVDDVLTTGSTANACARALLAAGALEVEVIAFAR